MLTESQIKELDKVKAEIQDDRLKLIVEKAIENWKGNVNPATGEYGLYENSLNKEGHQRYVATYAGTGCCLLGSAALGTETKCGIHWELMMSEFKISYSEHNAIVNGFDGITECDTDHPWYKIARKIGEIVCP